MKTSPTMMLSRSSAPRVSSKTKRRSVETQQLDSLLCLMRRERGKAIRFEITAERDSKVYIAGTFNQWNPNTHPLAHHPEEGDGVFRATLHLPAGTHEYKFVINGVWHLDSACPNWVLNEHGTLNSVVRV